MTDEQGDLGNYVRLSNLLTSSLVEARRRNDPESGSQVVEAIWNAQDPSLLTLVMGNLASLVVMLEQRANNAHGPLLDRDSVIFDGEATPAMTAASDQMNAAAKEGDYRAFAVAAVDGQVNALRYDIDNPKYDVNLEHVLLAMQLLDQTSVCLIAAEALLRLAR